MMNNTIRNRLPPTPTRWLALIAAAGFALAFFIRALRQAPQQAAIAPSFPTPTEATPVIQPPARKQLWRRVRLITITLLLAGAILLLEQLSPGAGMLLFWGMMAVALGVAIWRWPPTNRLILNWSATLKRNRALIYALSVTVALFSLIFAAWSFQDSRDFQLPLTEPLLFTLVGVLSLGVAMRISRATLPTLPLLPAVMPVSTVRMNRWLIRIGIVILLFLAEVNGHILDIALLKNVSTNVQFILLVAGVTITTLGVGGLFQQNNGLKIVSLFTRGDFLTRRSSLLLVGALFGLTLLAVVCRFWELDNAMRFLIDEESFIGAAHFLRNTPTAPLLQPFSSIAAFPYLFPYGQLKTLELFGQNLVGLRAFGAILGVLYVPAIYFLARTLFDRKTALLAALCIAVFPPHIQFSRIAISEIASPLFAILSFTFLGRGMKHGRRMDYAIGGAMIGLTHYFHEGGRLLFTPLAAAWLIGCWIAGQREDAAQNLELPATNIALKRWRIVFEIYKANTLTTLRRLLPAILALVIVAAPIYYTLIGIERPLFARMVDNNSGLSSAYWQILFDGENLRDHIDNHVLPAFLVYVQQVDNTLFYAGNLGLIIPAVLPFFLVGVFYALWRFRAPGMMLLLGWIFTTSLGNTFMVDSAGSPRFVMVFPAIALAIAVGIRYGVALLWRDERRNTLLMAVIGLAVAFSQVDYYFNEHLPLFNRQFRAVNATPDNYDAALRSLDFPAGTYIHIVSRRLANQIESVGMLNLYRGGLYLETLSTRQFTEFYIDRLTCRVDHVFFVEREDFETIANLRERFFLRPAEYTPFTLFPPEQPLIMLYAPYMRGSEGVYGREC